MQWGGNIIDATASKDGVTLDVPAPVGFPPVFYNIDSVWGSELRSYIQKMGYDTGYVF